MVNTVSMIIFFLVLTTYLQSKEQVWVGRASDHNDLTVWFDKFIFDNQIHGQAQLVRLPRIACGPRKPDIISPYEEWGLASAKHETGHTDPVHSPTRHNDAVGQQFGVHIIPDCSTSNSSELCGGIVFDSIKTIHGDLYTRRRGETKSKGVATAFHLCDHMMSIKM